MNRTLTKKNPNKSLGRGLSKKSHNLSKGPSPMRKKSLRFSLGKKSLGKKSLGKKSLGKKSISVRKSLSLSKKGLSVRNSLILSKKGHRRETLKNSLTETAAAQQIFVKNYHLYNKKKITDALKNSGIHKIDVDMAKSFIDSQITPLRRRAAKDLIDNTHYITLQDTIDIIYDLILRTYADIETYYTAEERPTANIYMYCGENNKSFYFFSCIALYSIEKYNIENKTNKIQIPIFVNTLSKEFLLNLGNDTLIMVDDVSYSGSQLSGTLNGFYEAICIKGEKAPPNIYVLLTALNTISLNRLSNVTLTKSTSGVALTRGPTPFKIYYEADRLYDPLVKVIGIERYFYVSLFFNAWLNQSTHIAMYLDHKVADGISTYKNTYLYGPIVPATYNIEYAYGNLFGNGIYAHSYFSEQENIDLIDAFMIEEPEYVDEPVKTPARSFYKLHGSRLNNIMGFLINRSLKEIIDNHPNPDYDTKMVSDVIKIKTNKDSIRFIPFINTCNESAELMEIINNEKIINMDYGDFMADPDINKADLSVLSKSADSLELLAIINSYRCPNNWYKDPTHPLKLK